MKWIAAHPEFVDLWYDDVDIETGDFIVEEYDNVDLPVQTARVLLGAADPHALERFDRIRGDGYGKRPPHWADDSLLALRDVLAVIPDPSQPRAGVWRLDDPVVDDLTGKLPWTRRFADEPLAERRQSIEAEWLTARTLHTFVEKAVSDGLVVIAD